MKRVLLAMLWTCACVEPQPAQRSLTGPLVVAVLATPAEAPPGAAVRYELVIASPTGPQQSEARWSYCTTARPAEENAAVAAVCARTNESTPQVAQLLDTTLPRDACARFGSETASGLRPVDADPTGGYYQPLRIHVNGVPDTVFRHRVQCALPGAPLETTLRFVESYRANLPPELGALQATREANRLRVEAVLAEDAYERYPHFDGQALRTRREQLEAHWYVSAGTLLDSEQALESTHLQNDWQLAPGQEGWLWLVVRDDRGAMAVRSLHVSGLR